MNCTMHRHTLLLALCLGLAASTVAAEFCEGAVEAGAAKEGEWELLPEVRWGRGSSSSAAAPVVRCNWLCRHLSASCFSAHCSPPVACVCLQLADGGVDVPEDVLNATILVRRDKRGEAGVRQKEGAVRELTAGSMVGRKLACWACWGQPHRMAAPPSRPLSAYLHSHSRLPPRPARPPLPACPAVL